MKTTIKSENDVITIWAQTPTSGVKVMKPGLKFKVENSGFMGKLNFISLMLALFFGTAALPHILIRYYTVPSQRDARKSTIVAILAIGLFYILTMYMGLGAMVTGVLDPESSNMSAPLLARYFGIALFSIISAIAFATVLGTVSGLIVASSGAVAHDLMNRYMGIEMSNEKKVTAGKAAAVGVGIIAIILGILFKGMNVSFLVGWAFAVAASANLPAILMLLFWKKTTAKGIAASIFVGIMAALTIILLSPSMFLRYGLEASSAPFGLNNPGIISIPLSFLTLYVVSLMTQKDNKELA
jgi:cation/acetate symporter